MPNKPRKRKLSQSPQARYKRRMKASGRCVMCGRLRRGHGELCETHREHVNAYLRAYRAARKKEAA